MRVPGGRRYHIARQSRHESAKVVSAIIGRLCPAGNIPGAHFC
jgi:hypothetical protein